MKHTYTKKEALRIIIATAKEYAKMLEGLNYLFLYRNRLSNEIEYFEAAFSKKIGKNLYDRINK